MEPSGKHPGTIVQGRQPLNVESPQYLLRKSFVTPTELFYVRNHGTIPEVVPGSYRLSASGVAERPLELWLEEIRDEFPKVTVTTTVQCAENRREGLMEAYPIPGETLWVPGPSATPCARADGATGDPAPSRNRNLKLKD
ncbi:MAG: molybdopterin-dependent oxidoreductase [Actinomycetota bacterium]|nr:molybdopterin-dependent oxidoreductase [Actinomycetota bacterium]